MVTTLEEKHEKDNYRTWRFEPQDWDSPWLYLYKYNFSIYSHNDNVSHIDEESSYCNIDDVLEDTHYHKHPD